MTDTNSELLDGLETAALRANRETVLNEYLNLNELNRTAECGEYALKLGLTAKALEKIAVQRLNPPNDDEGDAPGSQADLIVKMVLGNGVELVHDERDACFAVLNEDGARKTMAINSRAFRLWMSSIFFETFNKVPRAASFVDAKAALEGKALHKGPMASVGLRVAGDSQCIEIDLGGPDWKCVRITASGWTIESQSRRLFFRSKYMLEMPAPERGGTLTDLRRFIRATDEHWPFFPSWLMSAFHPDGPYPILGLAGEYGTAKTTTARVLVALTDPSSSPVRSLPRDSREIVIAAQHTRVLAFDNISTISADTSDALCRLCTGGGDGKRTLYENDEMTLLEAKRPAIITAIVDVATKPDLLSRLLATTLTTIPASERIDEDQFWIDFETARPRLLGALFDALAAALRNRAKTRTEIKRKPRMADAYIWAMAAQPSLGVSKEALEDAWFRAAADAHALSLEGSPIVAPLCLHVQHQATCWQGSGTDLLKALAGVAGDEATRSKDWPKSSQVLSGVLRTLAPSLRAVHGIDVTLGRTRKTRFVHITQRDVKSAEDCVTCVTPVTAAQNRDALASNGDALGAIAPRSASPDSCSGDARDDRDEVRGALFDLVGSDAVLVEAEL